MNRRYFTNNRNNLNSHDDNAATLPARLIVSTSMCCPDYLKRVDIIFRVFHEI